MLKSPGKWQWIKLLTLLPSLRINVNFLFSEGTQWKPTPREAVRVAALRQQFTALVVLSQQERDYYFRIKVAICIIHCEVVRQVFF